MAKTIAHYRADLLEDLRDDGTIWDNAALDRCVERAVADLTRFRPNEKKLELTVDAEVSAETFTTPTVSDPDYFVDAFDASALADGDLAIPLANSVPDTPRPVLITFTEAAGTLTEMILIVKGFDADNNYIEENFYLKNGLVQTGIKYFAQVIEVEFDEIAGEGAGDTLDVGTGAADGVYVQLDNKSIKWQSDAIAGSARDTDYEMDYRGGRIAMKADGAMTVNTEYTIAYTKSRIDVDISSIMDTLIRIERVEYPVGQMPQEFPKFEVWGSILTITGGFSSQAEVSDTEHVVVKYHVAHSIPSASSPGSYPSFLDTTVQLAASAYALFMQALYHEHLAAIDLASVRTGLGYTTAVHTLITTALNTVTDYINEAHTQIAKMDTYLVDTAGAGTDNAKDVLANITDDIAQLRTRIDTILSQSDTHLAESKRYLDTGDAIVASIDATTWLTGATAPAANKYLDDGDALINQLNDGGPTVPEKYADYARAAIQISQGLHGQAEAYASYARACVELFSGLVAEANVRLSNIRTYIEEAMGWVTIANGFRDDAVQRINMGQTAIVQAQTYAAQIDGYLAEAEQYQRAVNNDLLLADRFRAEGIERRNEAWAIWGAAPQYAPQYSLGQRGQLT